MKYTIAFGNSIKKDIRRIPHVILESIKRAMRLLGDNPFPEGCKKIHGYENIYRIRVGNYRVVYEVTRSIRIIMIIRIGHRKDVYRQL